VHRLTGPFATLLARVAESRRPAPERRPHALIVDDEDGIVRMVARTMNAAGYETVSATSGEEALALAERLEHLDILVTDLMMPTLAGDELARRLRQRQPELKVLYLTGYCDRLFNARETLWADEAYLDKPFTSLGLTQAASLLLFGCLD